MTSRYARPLGELEAVHVPREDQVETQDVAAHVEFLAPEDLDRLRLLNDPSSAGVLDVRRVRGD